MSTQSAISGQSFGTSTNIGNNKFSISPLSFPTGIQSYFVNVQVTNGTGISGDNSQPQTVRVWFATTMRTVTAAAAPSVLRQSARYVDILVSGATALVQSRNSSMEPVTGTYFHCWVDAPTLTVAATLSVDITYENVISVLNGYESSASFTRPSDTNAYSAGDVVCNSTSAPSVLTFANIGPAGGKIVIDFFALEVDASAVPSGMGNFRLHLYNAAPTAINDNAAYNLPSGDRTKYLGYVEVTTPVDLGDTLWVQNIADRTQLKLAAGVTSLYGIPQTVNAYTPTSAVVKSLYLHSFRIE